MLDTFGRFDSPLLDSIFTYCPGYYKKHRLLSQLGRSIETQLDQIEVYGRGTVMVEMSMTDLGLSTVIR